MRRGAAGAYNWKSHGYGARRRLLRFEASVRLLPWTTSPVAETTSRGSCPQIAPLHTRMTISPARFIDNWNQIRLISVIPRNNWGIILMKSTDRIPEALGKGLQERLPVQATPPDMQALLLRLALREVERAHYGAESRTVVRRGWCCPQAPVRWTRAFRQACLPSLPTKPARQMAP